MSVSVVVKNGAHTIGEGPHWDPENNCLMYVDINAGDVHRWDAATDTDTKVHLDDTVGFVIPQKSGGYIIGHGRTISHLDWKTGKTKVLHEVDQGTNNRFNDGKCDPSGRLWAGTMGHETIPAKPEPEMGSLFSMDVDGKLQTHLQKISISNGLAWTADHKTMYYIDSVPRKVLAFDYDIESGSISNKRVCVDFGEGTLDERGFPDGMCIDTDGNLWVACYGAGKVIKFDPRTGTELQSILFPAKRTTSCCFGGPDYDVMYVTCARHGMSDEDFQKYPLAGSVFKVTGLGAKGTPAPVYNA